MKATLVCFALKEEGAPFWKIAAGKSDISILITGVGKKNGEKAVRSFLQQNSPRQVFTCGFAGGLDPKLKVGDVVFEICRSRGNETQTQIGNRKSEIGNQLLTAGAKPAKFFCADRIAATVAEKKKLRDETGADAVEMESGAIHEVCREHNIPCATVRVILDTASEDLTLDFNELLMPDFSLDYAKLALAIAKSPGKIPALLRLRKNCGFAASQLAAVLSRVL